MLFELPSNHTTVMVGDLHVPQHATALIRGHIAANRNPDVLILGFSPLTDYLEVKSEPHITFVSDEFDVIPPRRYTLIVVHYPSQTSYNNGLVQVEIAPEHNMALQQLSLVGIPFVAIVS